MQGDWHLQHRDRVQRVYVHALTELGSRLLEEERCEKAAEAFRRVLARDELREELEAEPDDETVRFAERLQQGSVS